MACQSFTADLQTRLIAHRKTNRAKAGSTKAVPNQMHSPTSETQNEGPLSGVTTAGSAMSTNLSKATISVGSRRAR